MKRLLVLFLTILLLSVGCTDNSSIASSDVITTTTTPPTPPEPPQPADEVYRVLISSDLHCTDLRDYHNTDYKVRMQHWVDSVLLEHAREPIDLLVINGDTSLDHVASGGAHMLDREITTKTLVQDYLSQLPNEIAVFVMPGNHEQYSNTRWYAITENRRQGYATLGNNLFVFLDTYNADLDPLTNHNGVYSGVDVAYVEELMSLYPEHNVYLISHYFDIETESATFRKLLLDNDRIIALFHGHTHRSSVVKLGLLWGSRTIAQTGNFSYPAPEEATAFWGFRELVITHDAAYSRYIVVKSSHISNFYPRYHRRTLRDPICYYGNMPET